MSDQTKLDLGCTLRRHQQIGIDAVVNARGGLQHLNDQPQEDIELMRDGRKLREHREARVALPFITKAIRVGARSTSYAGRI